MATREQLQQEAEWRLCRGSGPEDWEACRYFIEQHVKIRHPEKGRIPFDLRQAQVEVLEAWVTERYSIVLKARQIGYSTLAGALSLWLVFFHADKTIIMLSKTEREAVELFAKAAYGYRFLPQWMLDKGPKEVQRTLQKLSFDNESSIECLPSTQDPARGKSASLIIVDEWAFLENAEEAWASIKPVADVGGRVIGLSTAHGSGNFFHTFWVQAVTGKSRFKSMFYPWSANSDRDESWYEAEAEDNVMTPWILHQEYPRSPEEAFIRSGRNVFDLDGLERQEILSPHIGQLWGPSEWAKTLEFHDHAGGELNLYDAPTLGSAYVIGADVAEGLDHGDYSSAHVLDVVLDTVVATWHGHVDPDLYAQVLYRLGHFYNLALIGVENNNHGLTTLTGLKKAKYQRLYYSQSIDQRKAQRGSKLGWSTNVGTKSYLIDGLVKALRGVRGVDEDGERAWFGGMEIRDANTISELKTYVREPDGKKMHGSPHDDRVMSLAIAEEMRKHSHEPRYRATTEDDYGSLDWWSRQIPDAAPSGGWVIGGNSVRAGAGGGVPDSASWLV